MESIRNRRTIRKYTQQDVTADLLNNLLELSFRSSTTGNMQLYSVIVTRDNGMREKLLPAHYNMPMVKTAPVILTFCADFRRFSKWCEHRNANPGYNNFQSFMNAAMDTVIVTQTFCTLAEENGLGICYIGTTTYNPDLIIDILQLPELVFPLTTITVGYPDEFPQQVDRLPIDGIIHTEVYNDYTLERINEIYAYKESLPENQQFIRENNKETLAQVFTDIRYTLKDNLRISENLFKVLKKQGFI
jgi:Nitroreductase